VAVIAVADARTLAEQYLSPELPRRWRHVQGAGARAGEVAGRLGLRDGALVAAAWLHDIGYGPDLVETGFHPLDGARCLRRIGAGDRVARLVAHHSCAVYEARVRGLEQELLAEFEREESVTYNALVFCDMSTGPAGEPVEFGDRMAEIERRYGPGDEVTRALHLARRDLTSCCQRTLTLLGDVTSHPM
jgi:predicted hydrolase (HD superfamily)